jgi:hypothetical protein
MAGTQEISAWLGRVTGIGIAANIRRHYPSAILYTLVAVPVDSQRHQLGCRYWSDGKRTADAGGWLHACVRGRVWSDFGDLSATLVPYRQYAELLK